MSSSSSEVSQGYFLSSSLDTGKIDEMEKRKLEVESDLKQLGIEYEQLGKAKSELEKKLEASKFVFSNLRFFLEHKNYKLQPYFG